MDIMHRKEPNIKDPLYRVTWADQEQGDTFKNKEGEEEEEQAEDESCSSSHEGTEHDDDDASSSSSCCVSSSLDSYSSRAGDSSSNSNSNSSVMSDFSKDGEDKDMQHHSSSSSSSSPSSSSLLLSRVKGRSLGLPLFTIRNRKQSVASQNGTVGGGSRTNMNNNISNSRSASHDTEKQSTAAARNNHTSKSFSFRRALTSSSSSSSSSSSRKIPTIASLYKTSFQIMFTSCKKSSMLLLASLIIWLNVQYQLSPLRQHDHHNRQNEHSFFRPDHYSNDPDHYEKLQQRIQELRKQREQSALESLGSAAGPLFRKKRVRNSAEEYAKEDRLPRGCSYVSWQEENHPICNDVHSMDLGEVLHMQRRGMKIPANLGDGDKSFEEWRREDKLQSMRMGYLGSGLWRQVWKIQPRVYGEDAVLKVMKSEHPVNARNFDRHRRDALVMDVLKGSDRIVDIYGFCGNTVLTEFAGITLHDFLFDGWHESAPYSERYDLRREDGLGKVDLALDVMKGLNAMHERGIIHADLQAKQMLLDPVVGVKVNDFNRCRLMPVHDKTGEQCKIRIPSAPGAFRSPEEYDLQKIDTKADIFSAANILYGVVTGKQPWGDDLMTLDIQKKVMKGIKPDIDEKFLRPGTVDAALSKIVLKAYEFNPKERWSAAQIIQELQSIKDQHSKT